MNRIRTFLSRQHKVHRAIQYSFMLFYIWVAVRFIQYVLWALGHSAEYVSRPASVEGFLPIGAFLAAKRLLVTGQYDMVHPAALTIFLMAVAVSFFLRRSFCGYLCPIGGLAGSIERLGARLGLQRRPWPWLSILLSLPKYIILFFILRKFLFLDIKSISAFLSMQYWRIADTKMLLYFWEVTPTLIGGFAFLFVGSLIVPGFWCRGFCPYGAFLSIFSFFSPTAIRRDEQRCIGCGRCARACPMRINVQKKTRVSSPECVGCGECISACPEKECLRFSFGYGKAQTKIPAWSVGIATLMIVFVVWAGASYTGNWSAPVNKMQIRMDHATMKPTGQKPNTAP